MNKATWILVIQSTRTGILFRQDLIIEVLLPALLVEIRQLKVLERRAEDREVVATL